MTETEPAKSAQTPGPGGQGFEAETCSELLTAAEMRALEQAAIASGAVTGLELMERAGAGVVEAIFAEWPELASAPAVVPGQPPAPRRAVVLCGPGNNGGDGFVVARLLKARGWEVEVFLYGDPEKLPPDARVNYERWLKVGSLSDPDAFSARFFRSYTKAEFSAPGWRPEPFPAPAFDLFVDALFGIGLTRPIPSPVMSLLGDCWRQVVPGGKRITIDVPSGLCADSGRFLSEGYRSGGLKPYDYPFDLTVTFHLKKLAHVLADGAMISGKVVVVDIGLPPPPIDNYRENRKGEVTRAEILKPLFTFPLAMGKSAERGLGKDRSILHRFEGGAAGLHKFGFGHALVLSGPSGRGGAARLAARSALRVGAGLVTLACPPEALVENAARLEAVMLRDMATPEGLADYLSRTQVNAVCLGPGLGLKRARDLVPVVLTGRPASAGRQETRDPFGRIPPSARPGQEGMFPFPESDRLGRGVVLDADALSAYADDPDTLFDMLHRRCVLTPHHGEFARLFPDIAAKLAEAPTKGPAFSKLEATWEASARAGCTVLYKGIDTVISCGSFHAVHCATQDRAAPWLATAGSGDVLAGLITGLLARGFHPQMAAETGAWLHVEAARTFGPGLIAEDLPEMLPKVFRDLGL